MKVFITGATGFIGSHVTRKLIHRGHEVLALISPGNNLWRITDLSNRIGLVHGTLQDINVFQDELYDWQPEACIHLAWYSEPGKYLDSRENLASLQGSLNLLKTLINCKCRQFIGAGTCAEYEMKFSQLVETDKTDPQTLYAASKLSFQLIGKQIAMQAGLTFAWGRIFYLYGTHEDKRRLIPSAILSTHKGDRFSATPGEQIRDYLNVKDVANAFTNILERKASGIYNICSAEPLSIHDILTLIGKLTDRPELISHGALPYRQWEPMFICGNNDKLSNLGWKPKINLQDGLLETITWMKKEYLEQ